MGASTVASQRPLPLPDTQSTRYPNYASGVMSTIPRDSQFGTRPPPLNTSSLPDPLSSNAEPTTAAAAPRSSVLTPSGVVSDAFAPSSGHGGNSHSSQAGSPSLFYAGHMTGSWPTPGLSQPQAYTYGGTSSGGPGSGPLAPPPYNRAAASYGSAPSPSHQHFPGRASASASNSETLPPPQSYHDQQGFPGSLGTGGGGGSLGSPLSTQGGNQQSGLSHPMLGNSSQNPARQTGSGQSTQGGGSTTAQDENSYRPPPPSNYYPQTSAPQQSPYPSYASSASQPSPTSMAPPTSSGSIPRGPGSIPAMAPPLQYPGGRPHQAMASYASHNTVLGPVLSNMHHPGAPLSMVGGMSGLSNYNHHPGLPPHHPHHLYVHPGAPSPQSERPFKCNEHGCRQAFNRNHDLKRHQRIHLAIKPFGCNDCGKRFSRKDALKRHRLVKGCGGNGASAAEGGGASTGGNEGSSDNRDALAGGHRGGSPGSVKKEREV